MLKGHQPGAGGGVSAVVQQAVNFLTGGVPLPAQGLHHYRVNHQHNIVGAGVVRAQLRTLGRVQRSLEQRTEDGRLDVAPVLPGGFAQALQCGSAQFDGIRRRVEQVAVEMGNLVSPEQTTVGHLPEEVGNCLIEPRRVAKLLADNTSKQPFG